MGSEASEFRGFSTGIRHDGQTGGRLLTLDADGGTLVGVVDACDREQKVSRERIVETGAE